MPCSCSFLLFLSPLLPPSPRSSSLLPCLQRFSQASLTLYPSVDHIPLSPSFLSRFPPVFSPSCSKDIVSAMPFFLLSDNFSAEENIISSQQNFFWVDGQKTENKNVLKKKNLSFLQSEKLSLSTSGMTFFTKKRKSFFKQSSFLRRICFSSWVWATRFNT